MFWKKIIIIYLALPILFCLPSKAQKPGDIVSEQTIRNGGCGEEMLLSKFSDGLLADDFSWLLCLGWKAEKHGESKV